MMNIFKNRNGVTEVPNFWEFTNGFLPVPKNELRCTCGEQAFTLREIHYHERENSPNQYRVRLSFKCTYCSKVAQYGIPLTTEQWDSAMGITINRAHLHWREVKELLGW
jgi:hypothetical protein